MENSFPLKHSKQTYIGGVTDYEGPSDLDYHWTANMESKTATPELPSLSMRTTQSMPGVRSKHRQHPELQRSLQTALQLGLIGLQEQGQSWATSGTPGASDQKGR